MNRNDPLDDTISSAIFQNKDVAGEAVLEIINKVLQDKSSPVKVLELKSLSSQQVVIPDTDARYVRLDIQALAEVNGIKVFVNIEIQLHETIDMTNRSLLHIANILVLYSQEFKGEKIVEFHSRFPYLIVINLLDYELSGESDDVHKLVQLCYTGSGKPATDKVEIHHIQLPQLTSDNFDKNRPLHLFVGALQKRRGKLVKTKENTKLFKAVEQYEKDNKGFRQFSERFNIVRGMNDEEVTGMVQTQSAPAMERYITIAELRAQGVTRGKVIAYAEIGWTLEQIAEKTGLTIEQVSAIENDLD